MVTVPAVVLVKAPEPPSLALIVPLWTPYEVPVSLPAPEPVMLPLVRVTAPTVSVLVPRASVPPLTLIAPVLARVLVA